jgi:hypothetical protein
MRLKNISALFLFLFVYSFAGISQVEDEEVQMFSFMGTRSIGPTVHDFGTFKKLSTFTIELQNKGKADIKIGIVTIPQGVGVTLLKETLKAGEKSGIILVTIDVNYMKEGAFNKQVVFSTSKVNAEGVLITNTATYGLKGTVNQ